MHLSVTDEVFVRDRLYDFFCGGDYFGPGKNYFTHRRLAFYFSRGTLLDFFSARITCIKSKQKKYHISVDGDLEMDTRLNKSLVL